MARNRIDLGSRPEVNCRNKLDTQVLMVHIGKLRYGKSGKVGRNRPIGPKIRSFKTRDRAPMSLAFACARVGLMLLSLFPLPAVRLLGPALLLIFAGSTSAQRWDEAYVGQPFGVARITIPGPTDTDSTDISSSGFSLSERTGRALYPAFSADGPVGLVRQWLGQPATTNTGPRTVFFLFRGDGPLEITVAAPTPRTLRVMPQRRPRAHVRLLRAWWRHYSAAAHQQAQQGDYPPLVETYLTATLGRRLGLPAPLMGRLLESRNTRRVGNESLSLLLNVESVRVQTLQEALSGAQNAGPANQPVPQQIPWHSRPVVLDERPVELEPIAAHVPEECFYLRLGSFDNYLWLRELLEENGGDIGRMVTARGHDAGLNERLQDQLGLKESVMAKLLGGQVIADVALIGRDTYLSEGAAIGILFEARNGLLQNDLMRQRREAVTRWESEGAEMTTVEISDREVSLASTPDNRLRSFYVSDDKYHLVTTSLEIVTRFLEVGQGAGSLRDSPEFQVARQTLPLDRDDTVFVYLSPAFFRGLMSPQYQIELRRRMQSIADIEILQMAKWAARVEQQDESLDQLVRSGLVPRGFMEGRPDGSRPVPDADRWIDSLRGARGTFLPIPDVAIEAVTDAEAAAYQQVAAFHRTQWDHMDPLIVALKRFSLDNDRERLRVEARMLPFDSQKYGMVTSQVGPPSQMQLMGPPEDIVNIQLVLKGGLLRPAVEPHLLFFGMRDADVPLDFGRSSLLRTLAILRSAPAYLGAWPKLGLLDLLPLGTHPDAYGFSQLPFGLWRQQTPSGFSVLSFDPQILESTAPQLGIERSDHYAQARLRIGDISEAQIRPWFNTLNYQRAYETSVSNTRLLHAMSQQLGVPRAQAKEVAESLLGVKLICTLGGEYELRAQRDGIEHWVSTRWPGIAEATDDPFTSPLLKWFRGLEADAVMHRDRVVAYAQIDMQRQPKPAAAGLKLPSFNLFRDNPFKRADEKLPEPAEEEPFEELPPPRPEPPKP